MLLPLNTKILTQLKLSKPLLNCTEMKLPSLSLELKMYYLLNMPLNPDYHSESLLLIPEDVTQKPMNFMKLLKKNIISKLNTLSQKLKKPLI